MPGSAQDPAVDLYEAAKDEMGRALTLSWRELSALIPWGDTYEGISPGGGDACFERNYLWNGEPGGDIRVEVHVYRPRNYEAGVRLASVIKKEGSGS